MSTGWKLVASLGSQGPRYPQILVDNHGWCLRLGPSARHDDKYYSSFSTLLGGLVEHFLRRRLRSSDALEGFLALARAVEEAVRQVQELSTTAKESVIHEHIRRCGAFGGPAGGLDTSVTSAPAQLTDRPMCREAVAAV
jgi:hypothetical protein